MKGGRILAVLTATALLPPAACSGAETVLGRIDAQADGEEAGADADFAEDVGAGDSDVAAADADSEGDGDATDDGAGDATGPVVLWEACPLHADGSGRMGECAVVELPLDPEAPEGATIGLHVQRLRGTHPTHKGQLWLVDGSGTSAFTSVLIESYALVDPRWDWYAMDVRGAGLSDRLGCPEQEDPASERGFTIAAAEWDGCLASLRATWGEALEQFTTTNIARDLGTLIGLMRAPGEAVFVYGVGYASHWVSRYLQLYPEQATGVILDAILPPGATHPELEPLEEEIADDFLGLCASDPVCSAKLGPDPWGALARVAGELAAGSCPGFTALALPAGGERMLLRDLLVALLDWWPARPFVPAVVYRLDRCDDADVAAVANLVSYLFPAEPSVAERRLSQTLLWHVSLSELWPDPLPDAGELGAAMEALYVGGGETLRLLALQERWPRCARDGYFGAWPTTSIPVLLLAAELCAVTRLGPTYGLTEHFGGAHQYYFELPRSPCPCIAQSMADTATGLTCGAELIFQFVDDPLVRPDGTCLGQMLPVDFAGDPAASSALLGSTDMWENAGT